MSHSSAVARVAAFGAHAAVVFGSGLAGLSRSAQVEAELNYADLGWPCTDVPGHANLLRLVSVPLPGGAGLAVAGEPAPRGGGSAAGASPRLRLALACGRPHPYEGWSRGDLARSVADLAAAGLRRLILTNSCGALRPVVEPGDIVSCSQVIDLQAPPQSAEPEHLRVCAQAQAEAVATAVGRIAGEHVRAARRSVGEPVGRLETYAGAYVAVAGPQFETPAEAKWLSRYGDVVGMSAAPEVRAASAAGVSCCLLALVANRAAAVGSHEDVLAAGARLAGTLAAALPAAVFARWPEIGERWTQGEAWTS
jgi:purine-nucleoside phosphorylase